MDISATAIRAALARGEKPRGLLPPQVLDYIVLNQLYQSPA
jgi:nicotinic acid mononucleotide adenylyltransferase